MTSVVYVAGYGRSGSTVLALLLGSQPGVRSLGEIGLVWDQLEQSGAECSCGARLESCGSWGTARQQVFARRDLQAVKRDALAEEHWLRRLCPWLRRSDSTYCDVSRLLLTGEAAIGHVVDSSKTSYRFACRPWALARRCGMDVRILHLIRRPSRVLASCLKGRNSRLARALPDRRRFEVLRTLVGWNLANLFAVLNGWMLGRAHYLRVDFDDLLQAPGAELSRIGRFLGINLESVASRVRDGEAIPPGHLIAANRIARADEVRLNPEVDDSLRPDGLWARIAVCLMSQPIYRILKPTDQETESCSRAT